MSGANIKTIYDLVRKAAEPLAGTARALGDRRAARNIPDGDLDERLENNRPAKVAAGRNKENWDGEM